MNCGEWGAKGFQCDVLLVSLSSKAREDALKSCGWHFDNEENIINSSAGDLIAERGNSVITPKQWTSCIVDVLVQYGASACLHTITEVCENDDDEVAQEVLEKAYIELCTLQCNIGLMDEKLDGNFNVLGATHRDMLDGDPLVSLREKAVNVISGKPAKFSPAESIVLKMYGASKGVTLGGKLETELAIAHHLREPDETKT